MSTFSLATLKQRFANLNAAIERAAMDNFPDSHSGRPGNNLNALMAGDVGRQNTIVSSALNWYSEARIIQAETKVLCADLEIRTRKEEIKKLKKRIKYEHAKLRRLQRSLQVNRNLTERALVSNFASRASHNQNASSTEAISMPAPPTPQRTRVTTSQPQTAQSIANNPSQTPQQPQPVNNPLRKTVQSAFRTIEPPGSPENPASYVTNSREADFERSWARARTDKLKLSRQLKNKTVEPRTKVVGMSSMSTQTLVETQPSTSMGQVIARPSTTGYVDITLPSKQKTSDEIISIISSLGQQIFDTEDANSISETISVNANKKVMFAPCIWPNGPWSNGQEPNGLGPKMTVVKSGGTPQDSNEHTGDVPDAPAPRYFDFSKEPSFVINGDISLINTGKIDEAPIEQTSTAPNAPELVQLSAIPEPVQLTSVAETFSLSAVAESVQLSAVPQPVQLSADQETFQLSVIPETCQLSAVGESAQLSAVPEPVQLSFVPESVQLSAVAESVQLSAVPEPVQLSSVAESVQLSAVPEPVQLSSVAESVQLTAVSETFQVSAVPEPSTIAPSLINNNTALRPIKIMKKSLPVSIPITSEMTLPSVVQKQIESNMLRIEKSLLPKNVGTGDQFKKSPARLKKRSLSLTKPKDAMITATNIQLNSLLNKPDKVYAMTAERKSNLTTEATGDVAGTSGVKETQSTSAKDSPIVINTPSKNTARSEAKITLGIESEVLPKTSNVQDFPTKDRQSPSYLSEDDTFFCCSQKRNGNSSRMNNCKEVESSETSKGFAKSSVEHWKPNHLVAIEEVLNLLPGPESQNTPQFSEEWTYFD